MAASLKCYLFNKLLSLFPALSCLLATRCLYNLDGGDQTKASFVLHFCLISRLPSEAELVGRIYIEQRKTGNPMLYAAVLLDFGDA
ncbi:hypothetical protein L3X38_004808 [Prunus dulcis]|uniref:Secreted protein n=1 Tax=Prunus dulcis TaxID=3755 RepID=A0AAD5F3I2_PRUDU|nr:hypothetical protein L3X38_004808 [Prunus dulcis]